MFRVKYTITILCVVITTVAIFSFQLDAVSCTQHGVLSGGTQPRTVLRHKSEEYIKDLISSSGALSFASYLKIEVSNLP